MKNTIKSILAFAALMLCGGAWAANTMACWNGDFVNGENRNGFVTTLRPSDANAVSFQNNGTVKLTGTSSVASEGLQILVPKNGIGTHQVSFLVKYSGYSSGAYNSLLSTVWKNNNVTVYATGNGEKVGAAYSVTTSGKGTQGTPTVYSGNVPAEGMMLVEFSGTNAPKGTKVSFAGKNGDAYSDFTQAIYWDGVTFSDSPFTKFMIGGTVGPTSGYYRPSMTIEAVAIFDDHISYGDAKSFDWRSTKAVSPTQKVIAIDFNSTNQDNNNNSQRTNQLVEGTDAGIPDLSLDGKVWNQVTNKDQVAPGMALKVYDTETNEEVAQETAPTATWSCNNHYFPNCGSKSCLGCANLLYGYLDDSTGNPVKISNVPFAKYDVIAVFSSDDTNSNTFGPVELLEGDATSGTTYTYSNGELTKASTSWGFHHNVVIQYGINAMRIPNQTASTITVKPNKISGSRAGLAAVVLVDVTPRWTGAAEDGNWNTAGNWVPAVVPVATDDVIIPDGTTVTLTSASVARSITGSNLTLKFTGDVPEPSASIKTFLTGESWSGTVLLENMSPASTKAAANRNLNIATFGNEGSRIITKGVSGYWLPNGDSNQVKATVEVVDDANGTGLSIVNGTSGVFTTFYKVIGSGSITCSGGSTQGYWIKDASAFTGSADATSKCITFGGTAGSSGNAPNKDKIFANGAVTIDAGKAWTASGGIFVGASGIVGGLGTMKNAVTFADGATIDCTSGALTASAAVTFSGAIKVKGTVNNGAMILKAHGLTGFVEVKNTDGEKIGYLAETTEGFVLTTSEPADHYNLSMDAVESLNLAAMTSGQINRYLPGSLFAANAEITFPEGVSDYYAWTIGDSAIYIAKKTNSISIKMNPRSANEGTIAKTDANVGGFPVAGVFWNHTKTYNENRSGTTEILKVKDGNGATLDNTRVFYYMPNSYLVNAGSGIGGRNKQATGNGKLTYSYFDDTKRIANASFPYTVSQAGFEDCSLPATPDGNLNWEIGISGMPYQVFDLYIYQASDLTGSSINLLPIAVKANDGEWKYFAGDGKGSTIPATKDTRWDGAAYCDSTTMTEGTNYIRYRISRAALGLNDDEEINSIYLSHPTVINNDDGRLGLAGIQIVKVANDGFYQRKADSALSGEDASEWTKADAWENSSHDTVSWPQERGTAYAHINGDDVAAIKINDVIYADMVTLKNTPTEEGGTTKSFSLLTSEGLDTVDDTTIENPAYVLNAPVDATQFTGDLYLQSRITGQVALGSGAHVVFIAPEETATEENPSKAYPYNFSGTVNAIRKEQGGVFEVPSSMYNRTFNVVEGSVLYNYSDDTVLSPTITGDGSIIKAGTGTMQLNGANHGGLKVKGGTVKIAQFNPFKSGAAITVCSNGHLDLNGKSGSTGFWGVTLDGGYLESNAASGLAAETWCNQPMPVTALTLNSDSYIGGTSRFGMIGDQWAATSIALGTHTLHKVGDNDFVLCTSTISGTGKLQVEAGSVSIRKDDKQSSASEATIQVDSGAAFELYNNQTFAVKNICGAGAFNTHHASAQFIVSGAISGTPTIGRVKILNGACIDVTSGNATITELAFDNDSSIVIKGASAGSVVAAVAEVAGTLPAITLKNAQDEAIEGNFKLVRIGDNLVVVSADQAAQTGDGAFHATIADAISALPEAGGTIAILKSIDEAVSISGTKAIKIENSQYLNWANVTVASDFTGSVEFEFALQDSAKTDDENLRNKIRDAGTNQKFVFLGAGNNGVSLLFGSSCEVTLGTHLVFDGGTHTMSFGHSDNVNTSRDFGANASPENPTVLVKGNTTLNFTAKDLSGWDGDANADGIIRVNDTGVLNFIKDSNDNTLYLRQQLYLDPGSKMTFNYTGNKFRPFGGDQTVRAIHVPDQATDMTSKPAIIEKASGGNSHFTPSRSDSSVYVGANAKLIIKANIEQDGGRTFRKYGTGELEVQGNTSITNFRVYGGKTVFPEGRGNKGFQSSVEIGSGAELVLNSDDFVKYDGTYTYDISGKFTLGARQTLGGNNRITLLDGAVLNGVSTDGQGDFEFYRNATLSIADNANVTIKRLGVREEDGTVYTLTLSGNNATVNLDESRFGNGIVKISDGVTVKVANDKSVGKISGAGVVEYTQFPSTDTFALQDDWTGAFSFTGTIGAALNINNYGNSNSRVRLHGLNVGMWFAQQASVDDVFVPALELKDLESEAQEATPAITINAFSATFPYRFGKLVGDGTFNAIKNDVDGSNVTSRNGALSFTDASEFSGTLKTVTGGMGFWIGTGNDNASHGTDMKAKVVVTESASVKSAATFVAPGGLYVSGSVDVATEPSTGTTVLSNTAQSGTAAVGSTAAITVDSAASDFTVAADGANIVAIAKPIKSEGESEEIIPVAIPVNALKVVDPETQTVTWIEPNEIKPANQGGNGLKNWENIALGITPDAEGNLKKPIVSSQQTASATSFTLGDNLGTIAAPAWVNVTRKLYGGDTAATMSEITLDAEGEAQADGNAFTIKLPVSTGNPETDKKVKFYKIKYDFAAPQAQ